MKKTKKLSILAAVALSACACLTAVACEETSDHTHEYTWTVTTRPGETTGGVLTGTCAEDGETTTVDVPELNDHSFWTVSTTQPTHVDAGYTTYTSSEYGVSVKIDGDPALGHNWDRWTVKPGSVPTQNDTGLAIRYCLSSDGGEETATLKKLSDTEFWTVDTAASREPGHATDGVTVYKNSTYNVTVNDTIPATGHSWATTWTYKEVAGEPQKPTWNTGGTIVNKCTDFDNDGGIREVNVPALSVSSFWVKDASFGANKAATCEEDGFETYTNSTYSITCKRVLDKLDHAWDDGVWKSDAPTASTGATLVLRCTRDGDTETTKEVAVGALESADWTKSTITAGYNTAGFNVYTLNKEGVNADVVVKVKTSEKLETPFDNKKYISFDYAYPEVDNRLISNPNKNWNIIRDNEQNATGVNPYNVFNPIAGDDAAACFNNFYNPARGHITMEYSDEGTRGKIKFTCRDANFPSPSTSGDDNDEVEELAANEPTIIQGGAVNVFFGYVDKTTGVIVIPSTTHVGSIAVFVPVEIADFATTAAVDAVNAIETKCAVWDNSVALSLKLSAAANAMNIFVRDNEAYFNVKFKDAPTQGNSIAVENCFAADYLLVADSADEKLFGFGKRGGIFTEAGGFEGSFSGTIDLFDAENQQTLSDVAITVSLNGAGGGTVTAGEVSGAKFRYVKAPDGSDYSLDLFVLNGDEIDLTGASDMIYYKVTINEGNGTFTSALQLITVSMHPNTDGGADPASWQWFSNIACDVPSMEDTSDKGFLGWYDNANFDGAPLTEVKSSSNVDLYAKWSTSFVEFKLAGKTGETTKKAYFAEGDLFGAKLPVLTDEQMINSMNNTKFVGWYVETDDGEVSLDSEAAISDTDNGMVIYGKWSPLGIWEITMGLNYGFEYNADKSAWQSTNKGIHNKDATMQIEAVSGPITVEFSYWATGDISTSSNWDYLEIYYDIEGSSSRGHYKSIGDILEEDAVYAKIELAVGGKINITFRKDNSGNGTDPWDEDRGFLKNLKINGRTILIPDSPDLSVMGEYTGEEGKLALDGSGNFVWGDKRGVYTKVEGESYGFDMFVMEGGVRTEYYELTLSESTYSVSKNTVTVSYSAGDHAVPASVTVDNKVPYELADGIADTGFIFRGWYNKDGADDGDWGERVFSVTPNGNTEVYGRYDAQVNLTWDYKVAGKTNVVDTTKYVTDSVEEVLSTESVVNTGYVFVAWYTKDGSESGDWGDVVTIDTVLSGENVTFYAKWIEPHAMRGSYLYARINPSTSAIEYSDLGTFSTSRGTVDDFGAYSGFGSTGNTVAFDAATGNFIWNLSNNTTYYYNGNADTSNGFAWKNNSGSYSMSYSAVANISFMIRLDTDATLNKVEYVSWGSGKTKLIKVAYSAEDVKTAFIYDGKIYGDVSWTAKKADGSAITDFASIKDSVAEIKVTVGTDDFTFVKVGNELKAPDATRGTYTCAEKDPLYFSGGDAFTWGTKYGVRQKLTGDNTYKLLVKDGEGKTIESYTVDIDMSDPNARTYTSEENKVVITLTTAHSTQDPITVWTDIECTLPTLTETGFVFRGWFNNDGTASGNWGSKVESLIPSVGETYSYFAKWDAAATVTWNYLAQGVNNDVDTDMFVNDKVTPKAIGDVKNGTLTFVGWFTKNGTENNDWGVEVTASTVVESADTVFYAKWLDAVAMYGTYNGWNLYQSSVTTKESGFTAKTYTVEADGTVKQNATVIGTVSKASGKEYDETTGIFYVEESSKTSYFVYDAASGALCTGNTRATSDFDNFDLDFMFKKSIKKVDHSVVLGGKSNSDPNDVNAGWLMTVTFTDDTTENLYVTNWRIYSGVTWTTTNASGEPTEYTVKNVGNASTVTIKDRNDNVVIARYKDGSKWKDLDASKGIYSGELGEIDIDGYGGLKLTGAPASYYTKLGDNKISFVVASRMYVVTLGTDTYTKMQDGYEGQYTLPDSAGTVTLDGYGVVTGTSNTYYVVNDSTLTVFDPSDGSTVSYGITKGNFTLVGKSAFAGMTFNSAVNSYSKVIFDDAVALTGKIQLGYSNYAMFGSYNGSDSTYDPATKKLTLYVISQSGNECSVGDKFVFTYNEATNTLTVVGSECSFKPYGSLVGPSDYGYANGNVLNKA